MKTQELKRLLKENDFFKSQATDISLLKRVTNKTLKALNYFIREDNYKKKAIQTQVSF